MFKDDVKNVLLNRRMATWNLFVEHDILGKHDINLSLFCFKIKRVPEVSYFDAADLLGEVFVDTIDTVSLVT